MGGCVSSVGTDSHPTSPTAKLISLHGELREYSAPVTVSQVLHFESSSSSSCFVCNSDTLYYDDYIPAMNAEDELEPGQIYFLLSGTKLQYRLTASDMAALAVKASIALQNHSKKAGHRRNSKSRISPVLEVNQRVLEAEVGGVKKSFEKPDIGVSRPGSVRKLHRYSSRRARTAVRSFRLSLPSAEVGGVKESFEKPDIGVSRPGSVRKLHRYSSRRARMAVRSFRLRLTTIYEGSVL